MTRHRITLTQGIALYVGAVLGSGVIALPALAARQAGPASLVAWAALVVVSAPLAAVFAALAGRYPDAGGVAAFAGRAFGERAAAIAGWCFYASTIVGVPALGLFGSAYVTAALDGGRATFIVTCVLLIAIGVAANMAGLRISGRLQLVLSGVLAALLVLAVATSLPHAEAANLHPFAPHGWLAVGTAATLLVWSFAGWEAVTHLSGEFARPERDLPRATGVAVVVVGVLYLGVAAATVLVLGPAAGHTSAPLAVLLGRGAGTSARLAAAVVAVIVTLGTMNAYLASTAKLGAALGRDGALPGWFARGSSAGEVPRRSLAVIAAGVGLTLAAALATGMGARPIVLATSALIVAVYVIGVAAGVRLLPRRSRGWWAAVASFALVVALLAMSGAYILCPLAVGAGALGYLRLSRRRRASAVSPCSAARQPLRSR